MTMPIQRGSELSMEALIMRTTLTVTRRRAVAELTEALGHDKLSVNEVRFRGV